MQKSLHLKKRGQQLSLILLLSMLWMTKAYAQSSGSLNGIFSVSENTQVNFSKGNLQYIGTATTPYWKFAEHQWDYFGSTQNGTSQNLDRDLFGFAASGYNHGAVCYQPWSTSTNNSDYYAYGSSTYNLYDQSGKADWGYNAIANGGNQENQWRTLTKDEWVYLFNTRTTLSGIRYAKAVVNNMNGVILFPDNWNASIYTLSNYNNAYYDDNTISLSDWTNVLEPSGAVFLPASGYRSGSSTGGVNSNGDYWSSSVYSSSSAYILNFQSSSLNPQYTAGDGRYYGRAVRLVKNCPMTMGIINAVPNPSEGGTITGQGLYNIGETCTLTAIANDKFAFVNWKKNGIEVSTNPIYSFTVTENCNYIANFSRTDVEEIQIGSGSSAISSLPLSTYYKYSLSQQIYTAEEIGKTGVIDEIAFFYQGDNSYTTTDIDVYLKHTSKSSFDSNYDWESLEIGDRCFSGSFSIDGSAGWKLIKLDTPFNYNGTDNLLICVDNNTGNATSSRYWYDYSIDNYRSIRLSGNNNYDPLSINSSGSRDSYINQIKLNFLITQETTFEVTPNPINVGSRPSGAWMRPVSVNIFNIGQGTTINSITTTNPFFQLDDTEVPFYLGYNNGFDLDLHTGTGEGEINASLLINYNQNQQAQFDLSATAYTPAVGDVWETAEVVTDFPFSASLSPAYIPLYDNYQLPPTSLSDGPDVVYKLTFTEDAYLNVTITEGENGKAALYPEGFYGIGGPDVDNNYIAPVINIHEWLTYDNDTYYTNTRNNSGTTIWGYRFTASYLASYASAKMTQVGLYSNNSTGGMVTLMIYKGGTNAPETLVLSQDFEMATGLQDYYIINLDTPINITGNENIWVVFSAVNQGYYPAATTNGYFDSQYNGCRWYNNGNWTTNTSYGNWKIKAYVTSGDNRSIVIGENDRAHNTRDVITVGDGGAATNQYLPSYSYYNYSLTQQLYTASEIGQGGIISSIAFYNNGSEQTRSFTIFMVNTTKSSFNSNYDWINVTSTNQVFNGTVTMVSNDWTTITLDTPFDYDGISNLALIVDDNTGTYSSGMACRVFDGTSNCSMRIYSDGTNYNPYNPTEYSGTRLNVKNQLQLGISDVPNGIHNMTVTPGTYYLAASSTSDNWNIGINVESVPCPIEANIFSPSNNTTNVPPTLTQLKWYLGNRTTEYMLKMGTTDECEDTVVAWTRDLSQVHTLMGLSNNTTYYWKVVERNDGCPEGVESSVWNFTTQLNGPSNLYSINGNHLYVGDSVQLTWTALADTCIHSYNIYQDDVLIGNSTTNNFIVRDLSYNPFEGYSFKVTGAYDGGESNYSNTIKVYFSNESLISGYVYEQDSVTGIPNASITYSGYNDFQYSRSYTFVTDSTGFYSGIIQAGTYSGQASCRGYQTKAHNGTIVITSDNLTIDYVMDETYLPAGRVTAQYYPDSLDATSPYVKVFWNQDPNYFDNFESGDFGFLDWQLDPTNPWQITNVNPYEGNYCMKSNNHEPNTTSSMQVTMDIPFDGNISFFCKISSEYGDYGRFYIDGNQKNYWYGTYNDWYEQYYPVSAGRHTFKWTYSKNSSGDSGDDCFYIDNVRYYESENRGEALNRSFQHYRVYRTNFYNNGPFSEDNTVLLVDEFSDTLFIDATWGNAEMGVYKYGVSKVYEGNRESEINWGELRQRTRNRKDNYETERSPVYPLEDCTSMSAPFTIVPENTNLPIIRGAYSECLIAQSGYYFGHFTLNNPSNVISYDFSNNNFTPGACYMNGTYYFSDENGRFGTINAMTGIDIIATNRPYRVIEYNPVDNKMYGISTGSNASLYEINPVNGSYTQIGTLSTYTARTFTITNDGRFIICDSGDDCIKEYNPYSGILTPLIYVDWDIYYGQDMAMDRETNEVYWAAYNASEYTAPLIKIDLNSYTLTTIGYFEDQVAAFANETIIGTLIQGNRESRISWSNAVDKNMQLTNGAVNITVTLNSSDSPEGAEVSFVNLFTNEQQTHPIDNNVILGASGYHAWDSFRKGDYQVTITLEGYETIIDTVSIWEPTSMNYSLDEVLDSPYNDLYVSRTGFAMWHNHNNNPIPELASDVFEYGFDNANMNGITLIDADGDGRNWMLASEKYENGNGHNGSTDYLISQSYENGYGYLYPNDYLVFPIVKFGANSTLSFYARRHESNGNSESVSVAVSTSSNTNVNDFTIIQSWTVNQDDWARITIDLGDYDGQMGYIALVHNYSTRNTLDVDDVVLSNSSRSEKGNRHLAGYQVVCTDADNQIVFSGTTPNCFIQLSTDDLIEGEVYHCKVAGIYTTGISEWIEADWIYQSCDNFEGVTELNLEFGDDGNVLTWNNPQTGSNANSVSTAFACSYYSYGNNPTSWISYDIDNPQAITVSNSNIQVYGGDYCSFDGYVHATYNNNNWYKIDPSTGFIVDQGVLGMYFYDCAWDYSTNIMYGVYNNNLYLWDVEYNTTTAVGNMGVDMRVLACDLNGQLWGISYYGSLYKIEKTTGNVIEIGSTGHYAYSSIQSGGFDHKTGKLYWINSNYESFYEVDIETGQATLLASNVGRQSSWCIPYNGELSSPTTIYGAIIYRDDEQIGFSYGSSFIDTLATGNHEYNVRTVYNGTRYTPYWNTYFSMSCPTTVGGETYEVSATANPSTSGTITGDGTYINGFPCTLLATANDGYLFTNWTENGEVVASCPEYTFRVRGDRSLVGNFIEEDPHWTVVDNQSYSEMAIIGVLRLNGVEQNVDYLEVGAFCNGECRGRQMLTYQPQLHRSYLLMTVYGHNNDKLTFKVYDHLQNQESDLVCLSELTLAMNTVVGSFESPYPVNFGIMQTTPLQDGWDWYSTYIDQDDANGLEMLEASLGSNGVMIKSQDNGFVINYQNQWTGSLNSLTNGQMYMINTNASSIASLSGYKVNVANLPISLYSGWTWLSYPCDISLSIDDALVNFTPTDGDILKSRNAFASYLESQGWFGTLNTFTPGMGLMYYSSRSTSTTLIYSDIPQRFDIRPNHTAENNHWVPNASEYAENMNLMAVVEMDGVEITNDSYELAAFANGRCIGSSTLLYNSYTNRYMAFLTIYGEETTELNFGLYDSESGKEYYSMDETIEFERNAIVGSIIEPFVVHFNETTNLSQYFDNVCLIYPNPVAKGAEVKIGISNGIEKATIEVVNALGVVLSSESSHQLPISITAPNTAGVYTVRITVEGQGTYSRKLIVK